MSLEVIYVTRHAFRSSWSVDHLTGVYSSTIPSPTGIPADPALTSHGVTQAKELGQHLMSLDPPIEAIYSSPYYRCLQTITPFVQLKQQQLQSLPGSHEHDEQVPVIRPEFGLSEFFGAAPFDHPIPASHKRLKTTFPSYDETYVSALAPSRRGETIQDLYRRVGVAMQAIIDRCDADGTRAVVLCTHAAVVIALGRVLTGRIPDGVDEEDFQAFTCGLSVFRRRGTTATSTGADLGINLQSSSESEPSDESEPRISENQPARAWQCELDSDCSFLSAGAERGWRFSGDESFPGTGSMSQGGPESKL